MRMRVPFSDVDMHGHVHNATYLSYVENAINAYLRESGLLPHFDPASAEHVYYARKVEIVYNRPVGFDEVVEVSARVGRVGTSSLTFSGRIDREGELEPAVVAQVVWVCVDART